MRNRDRRRGRKGSTLLETVLAIVIMSTAGLAVLAMLQQAMIAAVRTRRLTTCSQLAQTSMARLKNISFYSLFAVDSATASANYGLHANYPYLAVLNGIKGSAAAAKFDRFKVDVVFMRRDATNALGTGNVNNLIPFSDADHDGVDDYDPAIRYFDQNGDGDYYETYTAGGRTVAEQPDTHMKLVTLSLYRRGVKACGSTELVSLEQFTGVTNPDSESMLSLVLDSPVNNSYAYRRLTSAQISALDLPIANAFAYAASTITSYRADGGAALVLSGQTAPLAVVNFYVGGSAILATSPAADSTGGFAFAPAAVTAALSEGQNRIRAQAVKGTYNSPNAESAVILDSDPPTISGNTPTGGVPTCGPYVAAVVADTTTAAGAEASGIFAPALAMKVNGSTVSFSYDPASGAVAWTDPGTGWAPAAGTGTYIAAVEAGDYAGYKASATWSFTINTPGTDNSAPAVAEKSPIGGSAGSDLPTISVRVFDHQSGIVPASVRMTLDGVVVVSSMTAGSAYNPGTGLVSYTPGCAFLTGSSHVVQISADHCAADPPDKVNSTDSWSFTVP
ncbi:MAG: hypothetical protein PHU21_00340 [Elusimicrobia bacterium]|nr:hypothetical protein [Elusimicrobiota bacterium]